MDVQFDKATKKVIRRVTLYLEPDVTSVELFLRHEGLKEWYEYDLEKKGDLWTTDISVYLGKEFSFYGKATNRDGNSNVSEMYTYLVDSVTQEFKFLRTEPVPLSTAEQRIQDALTFLMRSGGNTEAHHLCWVVDQTLRRLTGGAAGETTAEYQRFIADYCYGPEGEHREDPYTWTIGIAP